MKFTSVLLLTVAATASAQNCAPTYENTPGFPTNANRRGCYPTNYYAAQDLGQTTQARARTSCRQSCAGQTRCAAYVAIINKAADSDLATATCFFYDANNVPTGPRQCGDSQNLISERKTGPLVCFASSTSAASTYCQSVLGLSTVTVSTTVTATSTVTSTRSNAATTSTTITGVTPVTTTPTITPTASTSTVTSLQGATVTVTTTLNLANNAGRRARRGLNKRLATSAPPACASAITPAEATSACQCFNPANPTTTVTVSAMAATSTSTVDGTTTATVTFSTTVTANTVTLPTSTSTITVTAPPTTTLTTATFLFTAAASPSPVRRLDNGVVRAGSNQGTAVTRCLLNTDRTVTCDGNVLNGVTSSQSGQLILGATTLNRPVSPLKCSITTTTPRQLVCDPLLETSGASPGTKNTFFVGASPANLFYDRADRTADGTVTTINVFPAA